jgi:hypothetical protein
VKNLFRLAAIIAAMVHSGSAANIVALGVNKPADCSALPLLLDDMKTVQFPANWTVYIACSDVTWRKVIQREDVEGLTSAGITDRAHKLTIINGAMYSSFFSFGRQVQKTPLRILKHELGHIVCDSRKEDIANDFVESGVCKNQLLMAAASK